MKSTGTDFLGAAVGQGGTSEIVREIIAADPIYEGDSVTVNLNVNIGPNIECGAGQEDICNDYYIIEEQIPAGVQVSSISKPYCEVVTGSPDKLICIKLQDAVTETISYSAKMPMTAQTVVFTGLYQIQGDTTTNSLFGDSIVTVLHQTPTSCTPDWQCSTWGVWSDNRSCGARIRTCSDINNCGTNAGKPVEIESTTCPVSTTTTTTTCISDWVCTSWSECNDGNSTRTCHDSNNCAVKTNIPDLVFTGCKSAEPVPQEPVDNTKSWTFYIIGGLVVVAGYFMINKKSKRKR